MANNCIICSKPDSDVVPVNIALKGKRGKKVQLLPVCDGCIVTKRGLNG